MRFPHALFQRLTRCGLHHAMSKRPNVDRQGPNYVIKFFDPHYVQLTNAGCPKPWKVYIKRNSSWYHGVQHLILNDNEFLDCKALPILRLWCCVTAAAAAMTFDRHLIGVWYNVTDLLWTKSSHNPSTEGRKFLSRSRRKFPQGCLRFFYS